MRPQVIILLNVVLILTPTLLVAGEVVSDRRLGLSLFVPSGFVKVPGKVQGQVLFAFQRPPAENQKVGTFILVSRLGGVLGRNKIDPKEITAKNPQITVVEEKWKEFDIEVFRVPEKADELQILTFNAQVPLKPEAVQIAVIGPADKENELRIVLRSVLASLEGQTNWLNTKQRADRIAEGIVRLAITVGVLAVIAVVVWRAIRKRKLRRKVAAPGTSPGGGEA